MSLRKHTMQALAPVAARRAHRQASLGQLGAIAAAALLLSACGQPSPEKQLAEAGEALGEATSELSDLGSKIERTEKRLEELRAERRKQRNKVRTLEERLAARATDVAVFRAVQAALLEEPSLKNAAIAVDVEDGAVTLSGVAQSQEQARRAVAIGKQVAGVDSVASKIRIDDPKVSGERGANDS